MFYGKGLDTFQTSDWSCWQILLRFKSPFTGKTQKVTYATPNWKGTLTVSNISESQLLELKSLLIRCIKTGTFSY